MSKAKNKIKNRNFEIVEVPIVDIEPPLFIRKVDREDLVRSIFNRGCYNEPVARKLPNGKYRVLDGWGRVQAVIQKEGRVSRAKIQLKAVELESDEEELLLSIELNSTQKEMTLYEKIQALKILVNMGLSNKDIENKLCLSKKHVWRLLQILSYPEDLISLFATGKLPISIIDDTYFRNALDYLLEYERPFVLELVDKLQFGEISKKDFEKEILAKYEKIINHAMREKEKPKEEKKETPKPKEEKKEEKPKEKPKKEEKKEAPKEEAKKERKKEDAKPVKEEKKKTKEEIEPINKEEVGKIITGLPPIEKKEEKKKEEPKPIELEEKHGKGAIVEKVEGVKPNEKEKIDRLRKSALTMMANIKTQSKRLLTMLKNLREKGVILRDPELKKTLEELSRIL
ncbi:MAG: hypothetical protein J7K82_08850 [Thermoproteales archaeon]|nr:hypothetical protein [Thermoproteales archaeon]